MGSYHDRAARGECGRRKVPAVRADFQSQLRLMGQALRRNLEGMELAVDFHPFNMLKLLPEDFTPEKRAQIKSACMQSDSKPFRNFIENGIRFKVKSRASSYALQVRQMRGSLHHWVSPDRLFKVEEITAIMS